MSAPSLAWDVVDYPEPHLERTRALLAAHPEVRTLFGRERSTAFWVVLVVGFQIVLAWGLRAQPWWVLVPAAYLVGALADHALWTLIHDCTHNLVFRKTRWNAWLQILANLPIVFPAAISFRKFHLLHHRFQGDPELDADLASPLEARLVGNGTVRKALWLLTFFAWQSLRVPRLKRVRMLDRWYLANVAVQLAFLAGLWAVAGWKAVLYLTLSSIFAIGLHPVGASVDPGALSDQRKGRSGDLLLLRPAEPRGLQRRVPQRAPRPHDGSLVPVAAPQGHGAGVLRRAGAPPVVDRAPASSSCSTRRSASTAGASAEPRPW